LIAACGNVYTDNVLHGSVPPPEADDGAAAVNSLDVRLDPIAMTEHASNVFEHRQY
jgi:hypothetical protein